MAKQDTMAAAKAKIFGIGLSKTGTTSLANALQILGYTTKDNMGVVEYATGDLSSVDLDVVEAFDALTDTPIPTFYRELDARFPGSKFILTVRDADGWLNSCKRQFTQRFADVQTDAHKRLFVDLYATDVFDEQRFARGYERFVGGVHDYFADRPDDLLTINIAAGEGWDKLCRFLGRPVPDLPFPKANVTQVRWMAIDEVVAIATQAGVELMRRYDGERHFGSVGDERQRTPLQSVKQILGWTMQTVLGQDGVHAAIRAANKAIVRGLTKLTPQIPVLSRAGELAPYGVRREWNHLWLVDPLDGERAFAAGTGQFSVNIALIEDGRPIYGVVHAPATGTTYYASAGKGAYRRGPGEERVHLAPGGHPNRSTTEAAGTRRPSVTTGQTGAGSSYALAMCMLADRAESNAAVFEPSVEWQAAAAHAILNCAGMRVCQGESGSELVYNKKNLSNSFVKVAEATLAH